MAHAHPNSNATPRRPLRTSLLACVLLFPLPAAIAQQPRYSQSPEYQSMLAELKSPAPSPAYIATGIRPSAEPNLHVASKESALTLELSTTTARLTWAKDTSQLTWTSTATGKSWTIDLPPAPSPCPSHTPQTATHEGTTWRIDLGCDAQTAQIEFLHPDLARLTFTQPATPNTPTPPLTLHITGGPFFGLGERFWQAGLSGTALDTRPQDRYGEPGHNWTYVDVPFVYSPSGLGLYADTAFDTQFRIDQQDSSFDVRIARQPVPFYLFAEPSPKAVLSAYTAITGRPPVPPQWVFGPWVTALQGKGSVLDTARRLRVEAIPTSALWIYDEQDETNNLGWPFWFNSFYGDPRKLNDELHGEGFQVLTYVHPYLRQTRLPFDTPNPVYVQAQAEHLMQVDAQGQPAGPTFENVQTGNIDYTNPRAVDLWQTMITNAVQTQGFDGWMEDFGEWVRDGDQLAGGSSATMSTLYPLLYHKITLRVAEALNPRIAPFVRSGAAGSQAFSVVMWGGDQFTNYSRDYGLPSVVTAGITAGMSGFSTWGPDILSAGADKELWMRWVEFGALTPVMRDHLFQKPEHSYNLFSDADTLAQWRRYAILHSTLLPYFTTLADEAHRTGIPILRHLVLEYPGDPRAASAEYEYLLGQDILVAPVVSGGTALRTFYLPAGEWVSFWGGDHLTGGQDVTVNSSGSIPILVRAGSILPFEPEEQTAHMDWNDPHLLDGALVWRAFPASNGEADRTFQLPNGTAAHFTQHGRNATIQGSSHTPHDYEIILHTSVEPAETRLDGKLIGAPDRNIQAAPGTRYWWNPSTADLHVVVHAAAFHLEVTGLRTTLY